MYALCDCNNFFVSCERVFRPDLEHRPVVVMSGNDGCVVSRSNEAKALGIPMGAPVYQIRDLIEREGVVCFSSNFSLYGDLSNRVMSILAKHTSCLQQYSIDEGFLRVELTWGDDPRHYAACIVAEVRQKVGIPISIGIAPSKTLAKIASKYAKTYPGYHGAAMIGTEEQRQAALRDFAIEDVWGIGRMARAKLQKAGIRTALQFANQLPEFAQNMLHKPGLMTWQELNGQDVIRTDELERKQSITRSRTFATAMTDRCAIERELTEFCLGCARQLRMQHSLAGRITIYAHTSRFRTDMEQQYIFRPVTLPSPTADSRELTEYMLAAFRAEYKAGIQYKKAGIILDQISAAAVREQDLFDTRDREKDERLQKALVSINDRMGNHALLLGSQYLGAEAHEPYRVEHRSPLYTTRLSDIITVKAR